MPCDVSLGGRCECCGAVGGCGEAAQSSEIGRGQGETLDASEKHAVKQLADAERSAQLGAILTDIGGEQAVALAPQAQVGWRAEHVAGLGMSSLLGGVDEIQRDVAGDERQLLERLHPHNCTSKSMFAGAGNR